MITHNTVIFVKKFLVQRKSTKVRDDNHYTAEYRRAAHVICNLRYSTQVDIPVYLHNGSKYDFNLVINELAKEFKSEMKCIRLNTNKYMSLSIPIKKEVIESDNQKKKAITYNIKFMDTARHINRTLCTLVYNLSELYQCKCEEKSDKNIKLKIKEVHGKKYIFTICKSCKFKKGQTLGKLKHKFPSTFKLSDNNVDKFLLLFKKGVYPYEYMESTDKFNDTSLPSQEKFYSKLHFKNISDEEYKHAKKVWDHFKFINIGEYHDLYVQADTAQLSDVFENFRFLCLKEYQLDPAYFVSTPSLALEAMLKTTNAKIELFTDIDMVFMTEKSTRGGLTQAIEKHAAANNKYLPNFDKSKDSTFLQYLDANNLY